MQNTFFKNSFMKKLTTTFLLLLGIAQVAVASPEQERAHLLQLVHQIDAMKPTLLAAKRGQSKTVRNQFHYTAYQDAQGQWHPGVWEDLQKVRAGIEEKLDNTTVEARTPEPIEGDYMDSIHQEKAHE